QSAVDEAERSRIRERFQRGRREKARQGRKTGGKAPYGYRNPPAGDPRRGTLQPHPEEAATVRRIFREIAAGVTLRALAAKLTAEGIPAPRGGGWGRSTLRRLLESPVYLGTQVCGVWQVSPESGAVRLDLDHPDAIVVPGAHEALVTRAERDAALARLRSTGNGRPELLTGLLYLDGLRAGVDGGHGVSFYRPIGERGAWLPVADLNETVWRGFHALLTEPESVAALLTSYRADVGSRGLDGELEAVARHRDRLTARLARLVEMRADGEIGRDEHARLSHETRRALKASERTEAEIRERMAAAASGDMDRLLDELGALVDEDLSTPERRRLLSHLVGSVHVESSRRSEGQRRSSGGRFGPAPGPAWRADSIYLRMRPGPASRTIDCGCGQSGTLVAIVRDGRALAVPRIMTEGVQHA
ncbi:MAG TPA: recombinase family protein, partial [Thermoanaerobaculia bacterium]